jgi:hypothetical protein
VNSAKNCVVCSEGRINPPKCEKPEKPSVSSVIVEDVPVGSAQVIDCCS